MGKDVWFISDHHLSHAKLLTFRDKNDMLIRPEFDNVKQMNEHILEMHNQTVGPNDIAYFLGDLMWDKPESWNIVAQMHGVILFTPGNHDDIPTLASANIFDDMKLWYKLTVEGKRLVAGHVPFNNMDIRRCDINIHGHIHEKSMNDPRYFNVCVEQLGYEPIHVEDIVALSA